MAVFSDLYDYVLPYLPGAEKGIVDLHIRRALREFLKRTTVWRQTFEFYTQPGADTYQLIPTQGMVADIVRVDVNSQYAPPVPEEKRNPFVEDGVPVGWYTLLPHVIVLAPKPNAIIPVRVEAVMTVPVSGDDHFFPDEVLAVHTEAIAAGAIAGMLLMPGKPWTQTKDAALYSRMFGAAIRDTRGKLRDGGQPNQSTFVGAHRFGA